MQISSCRSYCCIIFDYLVLCPFSTGCQAGVGGLCLSDTYLDTHTLKSTLLVRSEMTENGLVVADGRSAALAKY